MSLLAWRIFGLVMLMMIAVLAAESPRRKALTIAEVLAASKPGDWRALDPENTLYVEFASGRVVIELAPDFAPRHVANVKALEREHYYDGLAIVRVQDIAVLFDELIPEKLAFGLIHVHV